MATEPGARSVFQIGERRVVLPVAVRDASSGAATFLVGSRAARALLPGPELDVVEPLPGRALLSLAMVDYRDNDLGDYNEVSIALFVRERAAPAGLPYVGPLVDFVRGRVCTYIRHLPVNQSFTCEAGRAIWGFPKTVCEIDIESQGGRARCRLVCDGEHVLTLSVPRGGARQLPENEMITYSYIEGVAHRIRFTSGASGMGLWLGAAELELGNHPIAAELRSLGLPRRALMSSWMEHMHGRFEAPEKL